MDFSDLYSRHAAGIFRFAYFLCGNRELAEDIAAETFARALTASDRINPGTVKAYLHAVARNLFLDWTRKQKPQVPTPDGIPEPIDPAPSPEAVVAARLDLEAARDALQHLPEGERSALLMAAVGELPYEEIGAALGCSVAAVKLRVHRARIRLRSLTAQRSSRS